MLWKCYILHKRLTRAINLYRKVYPNAKQDVFAPIQYQAYYLDPTAPRNKPGVPIQVKMAEKIRCDPYDDKVCMMQDRLEQVGKADGINFSRESKIGCTRDAHRLVQFARKKQAEGWAGKLKRGEGEDAKLDLGLEHEVLGHLFYLYFEGGGDITSREMLASAAEKAGLDPVEAREWLDSAEDKGGSEVDAEVEEAVRKGVMGVPVLYINDSIEVDGAQDVEFLMEQFIKIKKAEATV